MAKNPPPHERILPFDQDALSGAGNGHGIDDRSRGGVEGQARQNCASCGLPEAFYDFSITCTKTQRLTDFRIPAPNRQDGFSRPVTVVSRRPAHRNVLIPTGLGKRPTMSRCPYCRSELPGLETVCQKCWEKQYASPAKPWPPRSLPRLTKGNIFGFLFLFSFCFLQGRFHIPLYYLHAPMSTETAAWTALLVASIAIYFSGER